MNPKSASRLVACRPPASRDPCVVRGSGRRVPRTRPWSGRVHVCTSPPNVVGNAGPASSMSTIMMLGAPTAGDAPVLVVGTPTPASSAWRYSPTASAGRAAPHPTRPHDRGPSTTHPPTLPSDTAGNLTFDDSPDGNSERAPMPVPVLCCSAARLLRAFHQLAHPEDEGHVCDVRGTGRRSEARSKRAQ
jgi:hypothetical protein